MEIFYDFADEMTAVIYLEVPPAKIVQLQAYFEIEEDLGVVRTLNKSSSLICILTTKDLLEDCIALLSAVRSEINWRSVKKSAVAEDAIV